MENHYFDENNVYVGSAAMGGEEFPPRNAIRIEPPVQEGCWPVLNAARDGWDLIEDHRGREGWLNGVKSKIEHVGPLPVGWSDTPPLPPDIRTPQQKREDAYRVEADPLFQQAQYYQAEAEGFRLLDDIASASAAEEKARHYLREYVAKKENIRQRFPDARYCLNASGIYHAEGCASISETGEWLPLGAIAGRNPAAKPCGKCQPPALEEAVI